MASDLSNKDLLRDPKPNDDKRKLNDGKKEVTGDPARCQEMQGHAGSPLF
jgi:hypothetical protein